MSQGVEENRRVFLAALRSDQFPKGPIEIDAHGRPLGDTSQPGWCVVGVAHTLFHDPAKPASMVPVRAALGCTRQDFWHMQNVWNDSPLTFSEIAALIETTMGWPA